MDADAKDIQEGGEEPLSQDNEALGVYLLVKNILEEIQVVDNEIKPISFRVATDLCRYLVTEPNHDGQLLEKGVVLALTNYYFTQQEPAWDD